MLGTPPVCRAPCYSCVCGEERFRGREYDESMKEGRLKKKKKVYLTSKLCGSVSDILLLNAFKQILASPYGGSAACRVKQLFPDAEVPPAHRNGKAASLVCLLYSYTVPMKLNIYTSYGIARHIGASTKIKRRFFPGGCVDLLFL